MYPKEFCDFRTNINKLLGSLISEIRKVERLYLVAHLDKKRLGYMRIQYDLKAYCVFCHAAIEEYCEKLAISLMLYSLELWKNHDHISRPVLSLVAYFRLDYKELMDKEKPELSTYNGLRLLIDDAKVKYSHLITNNHGITVDHLKSLCIPVSVDVSDDVNIRNSLAQLAKVRGAFAHTFSAYKVMSPKDAQNYVHDCISLCIKLRTTSREVARKAVMGVPVSPAPVAVTRVLP